MIIEYLLNDEVIKSKNDEIDDVSYPKQGEFVRFEDDKIFRVWKVVHEIEFHGVSVYLELY